MMMRQGSIHSVMAKITFAGYLALLISGILIALFTESQEMVFRSVPAALVVGIAMVLTVVSGLYSLIRAMYILAGDADPPLLRRGFWIALLLIGNVVVAAWLVLLHERTIRLDSHAT
jgi:hypothetical protein